LDSNIFEADTTIPGGPLEMVFIRAPKISKLGKDVEVLATYGDDPVLVRQNKMMAATFHPELSQDKRVHETFLQLVRESLDENSTKRS
jgi:5'-phosphate synthase pdxT subunit